MTNIEAPSPARILEGLAPYPDPGEATPDRLARWFTVQAFANYCRTTNHPCWTVPAEHGDDGKPTGAYRDGLRGYIRDAELAWAQFCTAHLLRTMAGAKPEMPLGDMLRREQDSAEMASETLPDWLREYGIDPEVVVQAVLAERVSA